MEQTIPVFAMKGSAERAVETKNQHLGTKLTRRARYLLAALLLSLAGVGAAQAQCDDWYQSTTDDPYNYFFVEDSLVGHVALHTEAGEVANYNRLVYYITNTSTNETYRYENTDIYNFTITDLPEGTYSWSVRGICVVNGDSTSLLNIRNFTVVSCYPVTGTLSFANNIEEYFLPCTGGGITFQYVTNTTNKNGTYSIDDNTIGTVLSTSPKFTSSGVPGSATITYSVTTDPNECDIPPASFTIVVKSFIVIDSVKVVPSCDHSTADITVHASVNPEATCGSSWQYTINNTQENNTTGTFTDVPYYDSYNITVTHTTSGFTYDTIVATPVRTTCGALIDEGSSTEWWWGYSDRDMEGNNPGFYVACNVQCVGWNTGSNVLDSVESFEVWYKPVDESEWRTVVRSASESYYYVHLDRKGEWEWKARTICCGGVPGPWSTTVYEDYYFIYDPEDDDVVVTPICSGNDGSISVKMGDISELYYVLYDENDTPVSDTLKPTLQSDVSTLTFSNISQPGNYTIKQLLRGYDNPPTYYFTYLDTTLTVPKNCCTTSTTISNSNSSWGERWDAIDNGTSYEFVVGFKAVIEGDNGYTYDSLTRFEVQYKRSDQSEWNSIFQKYDTTYVEQEIWVPVNTKGVWQARARVICENGDEGPWSNTYSTPIYYWTDEAVDDFFTFNDNSGYSRDELCGNNDTVSVYFGKVSDESDKCGERWFEYFLINSQGDTIDGPKDGSVSVAWLNNITEPGTYTIAATIEIQEAGLLVPTPLDTTFTIGATTTCDIPSDGSTRLNIYDYDYHDQENGHNGPGDWQFYYIAKAPYSNEVLNDGTLISVDFQYRNLSDDSTGHIYLDPTSGRDYVKIPIPYKGNWEVKVRASCCGEFPGKVFSDWVLTDTIHHYVNNNLDFWNVMGYCDDEDDKRGYAEIYIFKPHDDNISPSGTYSDVKLRVRLTNETTLEEIVDNELEAGLNFLAIDEENNLPLGEYLVHPYISNDEGEELCSLNLDSTFTIKRKVQLTVEGDSTTACSVNPSVTLTANVSGGTAPYSFQWGTTTVLSTTNECTITDAHTTPTLTVTDNSGCTGTYVPTIEWVDVMDAEDIDEVTACEGTSSFTWNGSTIDISNDYLENGIYVIRDTIPGDGSTCPTTQEIHLTMLPNETREDYVKEWAASYTWPVNGQSYTQSMGGYQRFVDDCPTFVAHTNAAASETKSGAASNGCDSIYKLNLTLINGIPIPGNGILDTTLSAMAETDTVWVFDNGGMLYNYNTSADGSVTLTATGDSTLTIDLSRADLLHIGTDDAVYIYDYNGVNSNALVYEWHPTNNPMNEVLTSNSKSFTIRFTTGSTVGQGLKIPVTAKDISGECIPVYNVTSTTEMTAATWVRCNMQWEYSGVADSFEVKYVGLKWNDAEGKMDTINGPVVNYTTSNSYQVGCYNNLGIENCEISVRAICGVGDTSEACLHSFIPFSPLIIPHTGDSLVVLDSTIRTIALYDEGGVDGSYTDEADGSLTVKAADGYELVISQSSTYALEDNYDFLYITDDYDGSATNTYLLDTLTNEDGVIESHMYSHSDGFKFTLTSDGSQTRSGVNFTIYQVQLTECRQPYNPKAEKFSNPADGVYYHITDAGPYGANTYSGDQVVAKKTNIATAAVEYDTLQLNNDNDIYITPQYTMDVQLGTLCSYANTPVWSDPLRLSGCMAPTSIILAGAATANEMPLEIESYSDAPKYIVSYHISGSNNWLDTVVNSTSLILTGLAPSSTYEVRAASICDAGDTSDYSSSVTFNTECGYRPGVPDGYNELSSIPPAFDFESVETGAGIYNMPDCWTRIEYTDNSTSRTYPYVATIDEGNDNIYNALVFDAGSSQNQVAILPKFDFTGSNPEDWIINFTSRATNLDGEACEDPVLHISFGYITDPNDASTFYALNTTQATASFEMHTNCSLYGLASYPDAYPAFKVTYSGNNLNKHLLLKDIQILPNYTNSGSYPQPSNVKITKHPSQENKMVITWDCDELTNIDSDDNVTVQYLVEVQRSLNNSSLSNTTLTVDQNQATIDVEPGMYVYARVSLFVSSRKYAAFSPWMGMRSVATETIVPIANKQAVDTIGDISNRGTMSQSAPFYYGGSALAEMIVTSDEIKNISAVSAIAFRMEDANSCDVEGFQNVDIYMKDVDFSEFSSSGTNGNYTINDFADYQLEESDRISSAYVTPYERGWLMIKMNATFTHDPSKNLLIAIVSNAGDATDGQTDKTYFELDQDSDGKCISITGSSDFSSLAQTQIVNPVTMRPQMMLFEDKNCTPEMETETISVCENASQDWRGMTISFDDPDIDIHYDSDLNVYIYNDTVANAANGGTCDSIYQLRITKLNMERDGATPWPGEPGVYQSNNTYTATSCGPYTWTDGNVYTENTGYYYDEYALPDCAAYLQYAGELHYDTIEGGSQNGCDRIAILSLTIEPYFTVIFDTTGVIDNTAMETPKYVCYTDEPTYYELPECTMVKPHYDFVGWLYDGDTLYVGVSDPIAAYAGDTIFLTPVWYLNCDGNDSIIDYQDFCVLNSSYTWHGHTVDLAYLRANAIYNEGWNTNDYDNDGIPYVHLYDTVENAVDGLCDSIYILKVRLEDRFELNDYYSYEADSYVCPVGITWSDGNLYAADTGYFWWSDPDDNDNYAYPTLDFGTAPMWIDSSANSGCGTLHMLGVQIDSTAQIDTIYFIKNYIENATSLDTLYAMTMYVCDGVEFIVPDMPDSVTREGYDFEYWTDNPDCGWTVEPDESKLLDNDYPIFYGMWQSNCSDTTVYDTITLCSNDTISWHGFTWRGPEFQVGVFDTIVSQIGVIPGECDSIFVLNIAVPSTPALEIDSVGNVICAGGNDGLISVTVSSEINPYDYNLTYQFKLDSSEYYNTGNAANYGWSQNSAGLHRVYVKDGCGLMDSLDVTITEPDPISLSINSDGGTDVCFDSTSVKQLNADVEGAYGLVTYLWNNDSTRMNDTLLVAMDVPGTFTDSLAITDGNGCTAKAYYTYNVYDTLTVTLNHGDTTYCLNATSVPITVTVTGGDTNSGYTYQWTNYGNDISGETTNSYTVATTNAAEFDGLSVTVTNVCGEKVVQAPVVTVLDSLRMVADGDVQFLCFGASIAQMEVEVEGGGAITGQWYMNGTAVTDHNPGDADNKYTPRTDTAGTFNYSLKVTSNAGCGSDSVQVKTLTVYDTLLVTATDQSATYCVGVEADTLRATIVSGSGSYTYQWRKDGSFITDATEDFYVPETSNSGDTAVYSVNVIDNNGCGDTVVTVATIVTRTAFDVTPEDQTNIYCLNSTPDTLTLAGQITGSGNYSYQWYAVTGETAEVIDTLAGATNIWYVPATDVAGDVEYRVKVTDLECGDTTVTVADITVEDSVRITSGIDSLYACLGGNAGEFSATYTGGAGEADYIWYLDGVQMQRDMENTYTPSTDSVGVLRYYLMVRTSFGCASDSVLAGVLTVTSPVSMTVDGHDTSYCYGTTAEPITITATGGDGEYHYSWLVANNSDFMMGETLDIDTNSYTPPTDTNRSYYFRVTVTSGACSAQEDVNGIYVWPQLKLNVTPDTNAICYGTEGNTYDIGDFTEGGNGERSYQWYKDGEELAGEESANYMPVGTTAGTFVYSAVAFDESGCKSDTTTVGVLTVKANLAVTSTLQDTTYCNNADADSLRVTVTGGSGNHNYRWFVHDFYEEVLSTEAAYKPATDQAGTTLYDIEVTDNECGTDTSFTVATIAVNYRFQVAIDDADQSNIYCLNATSHELTLADAILGGGSYSYQWYARDVYSGELDTLTGATASTYTPATNTAGAIVYQAKVTDLTCGGDTTVSVANISVRDALTVTKSGDTALCANGTTTLSVTPEGGWGNSTYKWQKYESDTYVDIDGETATSYTTENLAAGTYNYRAVIEDQCDTAFIVFTVNVSSNPDVTSNIDTTYCFGATAEAITLSPTGGNGEYSYLWVVANHDDMMPADTLDVTTNSYVPVTDSAAEYYYRVTITSGGCSSELDVARINVMEAVQLHVSVDSSSICYGTEGNTYDLADFTSGGTGQYTYQWYMNGGEVFDETGPTYMPVGDVAGTLVFSAVALDNSGCKSDTTTVGVLTVLQQITAPTASTDTAFYCFGTAIPQLTSGITGGSGRFYYYWYLDGEMLDEHGATLTPETEAGIYQYSVSIMDSAGCDGTTQTFQPIRIYETMTASLTDNYPGAVCIHSELDTLFVQIEGGSGDYTYQWLVQRDPDSDIKDTIHGATESFFQPSTDTISNYENFYVMVSDANGCGDTTVGSVYMYVEDSLRYSGHLDVPTTLCLGSTVTEANQIQVNTTGGAGAFYYRWYINGEPVADTATTTNVIMPSTDVAGTYSYSVQITADVCGSDSVHIMDITVNATSTGLDTIAACDSLVWMDGNTYTMSTNEMDTVPTFTLQNQFGCDSVVTLSLTLFESYIASFVSDEGSIPNSDTTMADSTICSLEPNLVMPENEYEYPLYGFIGWQNTTTGDTVQPGDTVVLTGNTTFNTLWRLLCQNVDSLDYAEMCLGDTLEWRGITIAGQREEYTDTIFGVVDELCDSVFHLIMTVHEPTVSDTTILACDSIWWNGTFYTETPDTTQVYFMPGGNQWGCDSTANLNLTVNYSIHDYVVEVACDSYTLGNDVYTESGDLPVVGDISDNGCPFITHTTLTVNYSYHGEDSATACDMYIWNNMELTEGGDHEYTGMTTEGCDSTVVLHLTLHQTAYGMDTQTACDSLVWIDGNIYSSDFPGNVGEITYTFEGGSMYGCDSVAVLDLTMQDHIYVQFLSDFGDGWMDEVAACMMKPLVVPECAYENMGYVFTGWTNNMDTAKVYPGDTLYLETSMTYFATWVPLCEDVVTFTDTVLCEGSEFIWRGHDYSNELFSGEYQDVVYGAIENWCDSVFYLYLTVYPTTINEFYDSVVGSIIWHDEEYSASGDYSLFCGYNRFGCDSTEVLHLVVLLGIDNNDAINLTIYPNPTMGPVNIEGAEIRKITVMDQVGRAVMTFDGTNQIDIHELPAGIYTLHIETTLGNTTRRVVKR